MVVEPVIIGELDDDVLAQVAPIICSMAPSGMLLHFLRVIIPRQLPVQYDRLERLYLAKVLAGPLLSRGFELSLTLSASMFCCIC